MGSSFSSTNKVAEPKGGEGTSTSSAGGKMSVNTSGKSNHDDPFPCGSEMDVYLRCVKEHPEGLSGQVDECEKYRKLYKECIADYNSRM